LILNLYVKTSASLTHFMDEISTLAKRRLQAAVIKPIYKEMVDVIGEEKARAILENAIRKAAITEGQDFAQKAPGGDTSMESFIELFELWAAGDALELDIHKQTEEHFSFDVTSCAYAEMYKTMGLGDIGHILSCNRDGVFCEGYDSNIELERKQTIMEGADRCTFRYRYRTLKPKKLVDNRE